ncbi:MAG: membrane protein insertase YidC [Parasphingopyxis sp.]|nr:membrane protein insertase YidC [Sphingomonadales bacterium]
MDNTRNMILAIVLSAAVLFGWSLISEQIAPTATEPSTEFVDGEQVVLPQTEADPAPDAPAEIRAVADVLAEGNRIPIRTPQLEGSINLAGARIDDLVLSDYRETIAEDSPPIRLLSPEDTGGAQFAHFGWAGTDTPDGDTLWQADGDELAPDSPVTLSWRNDAGQLFEIIIEIDENFLFSVAQRVSNTSGEPVSVQSYSLVQRSGESPDPDSWLIHTGPTGYWGDDLHHIDFDDVRDAGQAGERFTVSDGWLGFNDKYWLTALFPVGGSAEAAFMPLSDDRYQAVFTQPAAIVEDGRAAQTRTQFFAGAKEVTLLESYEVEQGLAQIDLSVDWGWFYWFELPIFYVLSWLFETIGNFGLAIIGLTFIVRLLMFPIAQKQFSSMAGMRAVQPKMKEVQEKYKEDRQKMQQEMLALYQREKVNPLAGCLPIFLQIPVFYALYKVLMLSVEMRHEPFALWLQDLSAPDPLTPVNLFGLLAFQPPQYLAIGILPILLGITMWLMFKLNPAQMDPTQQKIFGIMPWIFMIIMAPFAAGLQLYWVTNNILTIAQQKWLYSRDPRLREAAKATAE